MNHPKFRCEELKTQSLESLYHKLIGYRVPEDHLREYEDFVRRAKEMAESGEITSSVEIRRSGIYMIIGKRGNKKGGSSGGTKIA